MATVAFSFPLLSPPHRHRSLSRPSRLPLSAASRLPHGKEKPTSVKHGFKACYTPLPNEGGAEGEVSCATLIWRALKLPIYSVALVPLTVGSTVAYLETGMFLARRYIMLLLSSVLIIAWLNLSNDVYDYDTGADRDKKESVVNMVGSRNGTHLAANISLAIGFTGLVFASMKSGDVRTILLLTSAILCGYVYQLKSHNSHSPLGMNAYAMLRTGILAIVLHFLAPPFRLSYKGLGEPLCFAAFGPFATTAFYFSQGGRHLPGEMWQLPLTGTIFAASLIVGLTTSLILFCSHFHQIDGDLAVGKMSPLVRIGTERGAEVVRIAVVTLYSLILALGLTKLLPLTCICFSALTLPVGKLVVNLVKENHKDNAKIFMAKYFCVRLHALYGVALTAGFVLARKGTTIQIPRLLIP